MANDQLQRAKNGKSFRGASWAYKSGSFPPIDPCGAIVDFTRQCYTVDMRFFRDDPSAITTVQWYFPTHNRTLPFATAFYRRAWEKEEWNQEPIGEIVGTERWHGSTPPGAIGYGGPCGAIDYWQKGAPDDAPIPPFWPETNVPICCPKPDPVGQGGVAIGGGPAPCCVFNISFPLQYRWITNIAGPCGLTTGTVILNRYTGACPNLPAGYIPCAASAIVLAFGIICQFLLCCNVNSIGSPVSLFLMSAANLCDPLVPGFAEIPMRWKITSSPCGAGCVNNAFYFPPLGPCSGGPDGWVANVIDFP